MKEATPNSAANDGRPRPILIVDDDEDAHFFLKRALAGLGIAGPLHSVFGGAEAIAYFEHCLAGRGPFPALVFLDVKMPGKSGFDVLDWARAKEMLGRTVIAMVSASEDPHDVSRAMSLGAHTYLGKPVVAARLAEVANDALRLCS